MRILHSGSKAQDKGDSRIYGLEGVCDLWDPAWGQKEPELTDPADP